MGIENSVCNIRVVRLKECYQQSVDCNLQCLFFVVLDGFVNLFILE